ncbi:bifunctional nuclease domain-containing protein [Chloroflexota bacterium]
MTKVEIKVDSIRQAYLSSNTEYPWVVILKKKTSSSYLPVYITKNQAELITRLLLDDEPIPLDSVLNELSLPAELMSKGILQSITIDSPEENIFRAKLMLNRDNTTDDVSQADMLVGNAIALSFMTKVPIFIDDSLLIDTDPTTS